MTYQYEPECIAFPGYVWTDEIYNARDEGIAAHETILTLLEERDIKHLFGCVYPGIFPNLLLVAGVRAIHHRTDWKEEPGGLIIPNNQSWDMWVDHQHHLMNELHDVQGLENYLDQFTYPEKDFNMWLQFTSKDEKVLENAIKDFLDQSDDGWKDVESWDKSWVWVMLRLIDSLTSSCCNVAPTLSSN